jgi:hypothetical protein
MRKIILSLLAVALVIALVWFYSKSPSHERDWLPEQSRMTTVEATEESLTFRNVRDWTYSDTDVLSREWIDMTVSPADVTRTWMYVDHFSSIRGIAHPFLSFEFSDGRTLVISLEARREVGEEYSPFKGAVRAYELTNVWSTERDMIVRRLVNAQHEVALYPLELTPEESTSLLRLLAEDTNAFAASPRFYNTITGNCMNLLAGLINRMEPGRLPYHYAWNLPGYAAEYLVTQGLVNETSIGTADLVRYRAEIAAIATSSPESFSAQLRALRATSAPQLQSQP